MSIDIVALIVLVGGVLISLGGTLVRIQGIKEDMDEFKEDFSKHQERDNMRFDKVEQTVHDQEVSHQAILTSLEFIITKLDKIEDSIST